MGMSLGSTVLDDRLGLVPQPALPRQYEEADLVKRMAKTFSAPRSVLTIALRDVIVEEIERGVWGTADVENVLRLEGVVQSRRLMSEVGETFTSSQVASRMGVSRQAVNEAKKRGALLAFVLPLGRGDRYPVWQFEGEQVRPWIRQLIELLGNGFPVLSFLMASRASLDNHRYWDRALSGEPLVIEQMIAQAKRAGDAAV